MPAKHTTAELQNQFNSIIHNLCTNTQDTDREELTTSYTEDTTYTSIYWRKNYTVNSSLTLTLYGQGNFNTAYKFKYQDTDYMIKIAKRNKDNALTRAQIVDNPYRVKEISDLANPKYFSENTHIVELNIGERKVDCMITPLIDKGNYDHAQKRYSKENLDNDQFANAMIQFYNLTNGAVIADGCCKGNILLGENNNEFIFVDVSFTTIPSLTIPQIDMPYWKKHPSVTQIQNSGELTDSVLFWNYIKNAYHSPGFYGWFEMHKTPVATTTMALFALQAIGIYKVAPEAFKQHINDLYFLYKLLRVVEENFDLLFALIRNNRFDTDSSFAFFINVEAYSSSTLLNVNIPTLKLSKESASINIRYNPDKITLTFDEHIFKNITFNASDIQKHLRQYTGLSYVLHALITHFRPMILKMLNTTTTEQDVAREKLANRLFSYQRGSYVQDYERSKPEVISKDLCDITNKPENVSQTQFFKKFPTPREWEKELKATHLKEDGEYHLRKLSRQ